MSGFDHEGRLLKVASGRLVKAVGGEKNVEHLTGKSQTVVQRKADRNCMDRWFHVREIAEIEAHAPVPLVTQALCRLAGGVFLKLPEDFGDGSGLPRNAMELAKETGDVAGEIAAALADDEAFDDAELAAIERQYDELIDKAVEGCAAVRALRRGSGRDVTVQEAG